VGWRKIFRKKGQAKAGTGAPTATSPEQADRRMGQPLSGYGANPYDTYTWQLHTDPNGERELKRAHQIDRPREDGESFNPYDTGKFSGGW
jgi:hypothetical protein